MRAFLAMNARSYRVRFLSGLVVAAALAFALTSVAVAVPAASAKAGSRVQMSVLPLPKSVIGPAAKSLPLQPDSGWSGTEQPAGRGKLLIPTHSRPGTPRDKLTKLGRISGYALDYGLAASGGAGVTEVYTYVDQYKTSTGANNGLALWDALDATGWGPFGHGRSGGGGLAFAITAEKVAPVGSRRFARLVSYSAANIAPVFGLDEQFTEGRYEADVTVWAGSAAAATELAQSLAKKLYARIKLAREGKLHAKPVRLPPQPQPGPLPGVPDLTALALQSSDFGLGPLGPGYFGLASAFDPTALSAYDVSTCMTAPRYCIEGGYQDIEWCPSANQASFIADFYAASLGGTPVDLSGVGDGARGFLADGVGTQYITGRVVLSSGPLMEFIGVTHPGGVQASDVQKLAQTAANKINAAGLGS